MFVPRRMRDKRIKRRLGIVLGAFVLVGFGIGWFLNVEAGIAVWTPPSMTGISTGESHACGIAGGNAYCWGANTYGQLGNNSTTQSTLPVAVSVSGVLAGKTILFISAGENHTCVIASDGKAYCWGLNGYGQLGNNSTADSSVPVAVTTSGILSGKTVLSISAGSTHTCAIASDTQAYCWGENLYGQLGNATNDDSLVPVAVELGMNAMAIAAGHSFTCAIASTNQAYCWGVGTSGQIGNGSGSTIDVPSAVTTSGVLSGKTIKSISAGGMSACAIASDNNAYCWGQNSSGQLGNNSTSSSLVPVAVTTSGVLSGKTIKSISAGGMSACAIASDNNAYCWGQNSSGQLGNNSTSDSLVPVAVSTSGVLSGKAVFAISEGADFTCALASDNRADCWGHNDSGQLGNNTTTDSLVPIRVLFDYTFNAQNYRLYANADSATPGSPLAAINTSSTLATSGQAFRLRTGIKIDPRIGQISVGTRYSCGLSDGKTYCWGDGGSGRLGNNSTADSLVPVGLTTSGVLADKIITSFSAAGPSTCAIASDNQAYCWGYGGEGQLGNNATANSSVAVAVYTSGVLAGKTVFSLSTGHGHTCTIASDNQAYCWGYNASGQLGNNSTAQSTVPVAVNTAGVLSGKTLLSLSSGRDHTCVIASDNQAYCWGDGGSGRLGRNSISASTVPVAVNTAGVLSGKTILAVAAGRSHTCAIASDNQAYCWGLNTNGQLGNNSTTQSLVPVAVNTAGAFSGKTIKSITTGVYETCAIASDNQAYCWGLNTNGQLGNNSTTQSLVPVAVDTSGVLASKTIVTISAGDAHACVTSSEDKAYCWGNNSNGQLGNNSTTQSLVPVAIAAEGYIVAPAINPDDNLYKLQFAEKTLASCSVQTGFADVTDTSDIAFNTNPSVSNGAAITTNANDPVSTANSVAETYISASGTFTNPNAIVSGKTGLWDFSLKDNSGLYSTSYCVRMAYDDGSAMEGIVQYPEITTVAKIAAQQSSYRLYQNADSATPGTALAATDTSASLTAPDQGFRLRVGLTPVSGDITAATNLYKLQFAEKTLASCSVQTGFADVTDTSDIAFNTNPSVSNGAAITTNANDPVSTANSVAETYISASGTFTNPNAIVSGKTGLWDFSLKDNSGGSYNTPYCFRIAYSDDGAVTAPTTYPELRTTLGILSVGFVDAGDAPLSNPTTTFGTITALTMNAQTATGTLGSASQKIRVYNDLVVNGWGTSIAATGGSTALWDSSDHLSKYDFNDSSGSSDGGDTDSLGGQLTLFPNNGSVASGCSTTGLSLGSMTAFSEGSTNSITLFSASSAAAMGCSYDLTGIGLSQSVPAAQSHGIYSLDMTITVVAL